MDAITILDDVVDQLTDHFEKSESVNYLYKECKKIVEARLAEMAECDFGSLLTWLDEIKLRCYKGKYKCIKRIVYGFHDYINHNAVSSKTRYVYKNDNSQFKKTSRASQQIIFDYVSKAYRCDTEYLPYLRNYISYYFLFLEKNNLSHESIAYHDIFKFKDYIRSLKLSSQSTKRIFNNSAKFIYDTSADLRTKIGSLILQTIHDNYIEKISAIQHDVLASFDLTTGPAIDYAGVQLFFEELREKKYTLKSRIQAKRIAYELLFFSFYYNIPITLGNALLWSKFVYENIVRNSGYRSYGIKFAEFLQKGTFSFLNSFFDSQKSSPYIRKHQIDNIPSWSKPMVDKYIAYYVVT